MKLDFHPNKTLFYPDDTLTVISLENKEGKVVARLYFDFTLNELKFWGDKKGIKEMQLDDSLRRHTKSKDI